jgi:hypothetical protein
MSSQRPSPVVRLPLTALALAAAALPLLPCRAWSQETPSEAHLQFLPAGLLYESHHAGDKEPRFSAGLSSRSDGPTYLDGVLGGRIGVVRYGDGPTGRWGWQLDVEAAAFVRLNLDKLSQAFESVDFRFGFPLTSRVGSVAFKAGYYHLSSHAGDEFLERNPGVTRINYVRDEILTGVTYDVIAGLSGYGEAGYAFYTSGGAEPWELQFGAEYRLPLEGCACGRPFVAVNGHLREEVGFGGSFNAVVGSEWRSRDGDRRLGFGLRYFRGKSSQYQFFDVQEELIGLMIWLGH